MPKYQEIYKELAARIHQKDYPANSYLPSESELMESFNASRDTVRKALNLMSEKGLIIKEKGKGSRVLDLDLVTFPMTGITSFKELQNNSTAKIETDVIVCQTQPHPRGYRYLNLNPEDPVSYIRRVRSYDGERVILDIDYLNPQIVPGITEEIAQDSLYEYIENKLNLPISFAKKEITVESASQEEKKLLDMKEYDLLVVVRSYTFLDDATLFQYTISKHRPDKFKFMDIARRSKL